MFETAFSEGIFWYSIIAVGENWCMEGLPPQRHNDKAQIVRSTGSLFRKRSLCLAATIKAINCIQHYFPTNAHNAKKRSY